jgi:regulatory protein
MKKFSLPEALGKIQRYCAYQERCHQEVRNKLFEFGLYTDEVNEIISGLITNGFLNEERFARAFAGGKFRMKKWGRIKIIHELESKGISANCIRLGLKEIEEDDYDKILSEIIIKKVDEVSESNLYAKRDKISKYAIQKGYEPELVWKTIKRVLPDK